MIKVKNQVVREQKKFWGNCLFHPTDAVEDAWGRRILDRMSEDGAINTVRIYAMLEDIVYLGEEGEIKYDFRLSDLRLSYLVERGYDLVISYGAMPDCIASAPEIRATLVSSKVTFSASPISARSLPIKLPNIAIEPIPRLSVKNA